MLPLLNRHHFLRGGGGECSNFSTELKREDFVVGSKIYPLPFCVWDEDMSLYTSSVGVLPNSHSAPACGCSTRWVLSYFYKVGDNSFRRPVYQAKALHGRPCFPLLHFWVSSFQFIRSCRELATEKWKLRCKLCNKHQIILTGYFVVRTTPHISGPTRNCSPNIAMHTFSQALSILCLFKRITHCPPFRLLGSSHIGLIPCLNRLNSLNGFKAVGRFKWQ